MRLSICIPTYNFGAFIGATLDSIIPQLVDGVEVVVVDGASRDSTEEVVRARMPRGQIRYVKLPERGGIDADIAASVELARGAYVWLFSADDLMRPGALASVLRWLDDDHDLLLGKHATCTFEMQPIGEHPVLASDAVRVVDLAVPEERLAYLAAGQNTEALFSFMGGLVVRAAAWRSVPDPLAFRGTCWEHVARLLDIARTRLRVCFTGQVWLDKRSGNDSFSDKGRVKRIALAINGYDCIASTYFGSSSIEAFHVRRFLRAELVLPDLLWVKRLAMDHPEQEDLAELERVVDLLYSDFSALNESVRVVFHACPRHLTRAVGAGYFRAARLASRARKLRAALA